MSGLQNMAFKLHTVFFFVDACGSHGWKPPVRVAYRWDLSKTGSCVQQTGKFP